MSQLETFIIALGDALMSAIVPNMFPPGFSTPPNVINELRDHYTGLISIFLEYANNNPHIMNPPYANLSQEITDLVEAYMEATSDNSGSLSDDELLNAKEYITMLITAFLTYANSDPEGIMYPPYIYDRPYPIITINRLEEFITGLTTALTNALIAASFPPALPASQNDVANIYSYYQVYARAFLTYAHANPALAQPPYDFEG